MAIVNSTKSTGSDSPTDPCIAFCISLINQRKRDHKMWTLDW